MKECKQEKNRRGCDCSYEPCARKGLCCECVRYHLESRELPGCFFPGIEERSYDRSFENFARLVASRRI